MFGLNTFAVKSWVACFFGVGKSGLLRRLLVSVFFATVHGGVYFAMVLAGGLFFCVGRPCFLHQ